MIFRDARYGAAPAADEMLREPTVTEIIPTVPGLPDWPDGPATTIPGAIDHAAAALASLRQGPVKCPTTFPWWLLAVAFGAGWIFGRR